MNIIPKRGLTFLALSLGVLLLVSRPGICEQQSNHPLEAEIVIDARQPGNEINPLIYGTNIYWTGLMNGFDNWWNTQAQYEEAMKKWYGYLPLVDRLRPPILRFPGGLSANGYFWERAIGPMEERQKSSSEAYYMIGTDEFLLFCEELGAEAMITVNINRASGNNLFKTLTRGNYERNSAIAADWVEYCNAPNDGSNPRGGVDWAALRARNGHEKPYGVKYWELGNELQQSPLKWYKLAVKLFCQKMRAVDPTIKIGVCEPGSGPKEKINRWLNELLAEAGNNFDFWIRHCYSPGAEGKVNGFKLVGPGASISLKTSFDGMGPCELCFKAEAVKSFPKFSLELDGKTVDSFRVVAPKYYCTKVKVPAGEHNLRLVLEKGVGVRIHHMMKMEDRTGTSYIDLKDGPELYYLVVSGAHYVTAERAYGYSYEERGGKPIYITEYNSHYELSPRPPMLGQLYSLREALNVAQYLQTFVRQEIQVATQWLLYDDMYGFGLIEGVGFDPNNGGEKGRDDPRLRPNYYVFELYREHLQGAVLPVEVQSPQYNVGPPSPYVGMCFVGYKPKELPFLHAVAALSEPGKRVALLVNNVHFQEEILTKISLKGFSPGPEVRQYILTGDSPGASNEPHECPQGDCVTIEEKRVTVSGPDALFSFPPHSVSAVIFEQGIPKGPLPSPEGLEAAAHKGQILLTWKSPRRRSPHAYHIYRSHFELGPYNHRIGVLTGEKTRYRDRPADANRRYTYAVRAANQYGEESDFSNKVSLFYSGSEAAPGR